MSIEIVVSRFYIISFLTLFLAALAAIKAVWVVEFLIGAINIEYENIEFKNVEIEKQSGELKAKWRTKTNLT